MAAMILRGSCVYEVSSQCVMNGEQYLHATMDYFIASQIMDYKLCIVGQRWKYTLLLIRFVHLHRVICFIHVYIQHTQLGKERL